jgi:hypothetical protein
MPNAVQYKGRTVNVGTIPIGIDPEKFTDVSDTIDKSNIRHSKIQNARNELLNSKRNSRERELSWELIGSITLKAFLKNYMPLKFSSLSIPSGLERFVTREKCVLMTGNLDSSCSSFSRRRRRISKPPYNSQ